ncbi:hypothetical protein HanOQP8_Chr05g0182341 [Helianthus annuus]|nr:hypothetical protein HanOQP8_Chr05g0182341 [Helianthus annuus]KAJ0749563.1 hypothetical protein HanLR1_Chr05g0171341 [Helianthus annuus]
MVGTDLKSEVKKLMEKRSALEAEMNVIIERLCQPGGPGLSGNLVDSEAFRLKVESVTVRNRNRNESVRKEFLRERIKEVRRNVEV